MAIQLAKPNQVFRLRTMSMCYDIAQMERILLGCDRGRRLVRYFRDECSKPHRQCLVVDVAEGNVTATVAGFLVYAQTVRKAHLITLLAVDPLYRRAGVGRALVESLVDQARFDERHLISAQAPERLLEAQLFLRGCGFVAQRASVRAADSIFDEACYLFCRDLDEAQAAT